MLITEKSYFKYRKKILNLEDVPLPEIAYQVGTPFYVYSATAIKSNYEKFILALGELNYSISYAVKANSNIAILKLLGSLGAGMDIVSSGEYLRAKAAGIPGNKIVFSGVGKTKDEMNLAIEGGIKQFNVESESELRVLNSVAVAQNKTVTISIRINPDIDAQTHEKISTGKADNKFGIPYEDAEKIFQKASQLSNLKVSGIAVHIGSQLTDLEPYRQTFLKLAELVHVLKSRGHDVKSLDLGGGIGIAYSDNKKVIDLLEYGKLVKSVLGHLNCKFEFEPGRLIVGNAGLLVCSVLYLKYLKNKKFIVVDSGMNDLSRPSMYGAYHEIIPIKEENNTSRIKVDVVGPICETGDTFARDRSFPIVEEKDLVAFKSCGAYGSVMASEYNSRPLIPEVFVKGTNFSIIRPRPSIMSVIQRDIVPDWLD
ncbi:MAG: diaminopimelate decarboxylase [Paracoccaceae bacterium]|nr:diaminopimelate decarboxylase [Paracoccaceae bacterium]